MALTNPISINDIKTELNSSDNDLETLGYKHLNKTVGTPVGLNDFVGVELPNVGYHNFINPGSFYITFEVAYTAPILHDVKLRVEYGEGGFDDFYTPYMSNPSGFIEFHGNTASYGVTYRYQVKFTWGNGMVLETGELGIFQI